jgi:hypothetical protein
MPIVAFRVQFLAISLGLVRFGISYRLSPSIRLALLLQPLSMGNLLRPIADHTPMFTAPSVVVDPILEAIDDKARWPAYRIRFHS